MYIGQLKEVFATSVPSRIAAFFGEPIQVGYTVVLLYKIINPVADKAESFSEHAKFDKFTTYYIIFTKT